LGEGRRGDAVTLAGKEKAEMPRKNKQTEQDKKDDADLSRLLRILALECERELQRRGKTTGIVALKNAVKERG
jgi:hypothetical protein